MEKAVQANNYYEGVLQLRNCTKEAVAFVRKSIDKERGVSIAKEKKLPEGLDLFISSNKFLKKLARLLKQRFIGIVKQSSKLHTADMQSGKRIYRGTILFRMPSFQKGDIGMLKGDEVRILSVSGKVALQETKSGKKMQLKFDEVEKNFRKN